MGTAVKKRRRNKVVASALTENEEKALDLRAAGASYREIARALNFSSASSALECVKRAVGKTQFESAAEALMMDLANLDDWAKRCTHRLRTTGDLGQVDRLMRIMEKRHQLLGVDSTTLSEKMGKKTTAGGATIVVSPSEVGFIQGLMASVGVDPESPEAQKFLAGARQRDAQKELPAGSPEPAPIRRAGKKKLVVKKKKAAEDADTFPRPTEVVEVPRVPVAEIETPVLTGDLYGVGAAPMLRETTI